MKILLIKLKHIGDSLLLTAATRAIRQQYPDAEISVLVRQGCEGILEGAVSIDHIYTSVAPESSNRNFISRCSEFKTIFKLRRQCYDVILELTRGDRGRWWTMALRGRMKATYEMKSGKVFWARVFDSLLSVPSPEVHSVYQDFAIVKEILSLECEEPAPLEFVCDEVGVSTEGSENVVLIHPATRWKRKQWPEESWVSLINHLVGQGERIVLSSGPAPEEVALCQRLCQRYSDGQVSFTGGQLSWMKLSGVLARSKVFIGVDTAAMHLAAACGVPTVALFLPWIAPMWYPWKVPHEVVVAEGFPTQATAELNDLSKAVAAMEAISCERVLQAFNQIVERTGR